MPPIALILTFWLAFAAPTWADFDEGVAAYNRGNYETAIREFRSLAEQGDSIAQFNLGIMYKNGQGVSRDYTEALKWYDKAAKQGDARAQYVLGRMYDNGQGVTQSYVQAHMWYSLAAAKGSYAAAAAKNRDYVAANMTPDDVSKAQRMACEWLAKHGKAECSPPTPARRPSPTRQTKSSNQPAR